MTIRDKYFNRGYANAVINLILLYGETTESQSVFNQHFGSNTNFEEMGFFGNYLDILNKCKL